MSCPMPGCDYAAGTACAMTGCPGRKLFHEPAAHTPFLSRNAAQPAAGDIAPPRICVSQRVPGGFLFTQGEARVMTARASGAGGLVSSLRDGAALVPFHGEAM